MKNINWFKEEIEPYLHEYEIIYKFYEKGDFGSLNQIEFNSKNQGGEIDFWSTGWLGIYLISYINGEVLLNVFLEPHQEEEKADAFINLKKMIQK